MLRLPITSLLIRLSVLAALALVGVLAPAPVRAADPDYSGYSALLKKYTRVINAKGKPLETRFDYEQLFIDERIWQTKRAEGLETLHTQLLSLDPATLSPAERTAWAINAYNFLVIERITARLLVPGRKFMRYDSPKQINNEEGMFFAAKVARINGEDYSITGFQRRFVYGDTASQPMADGFTPREHSGDPRIMFALVHGSMCSGPILPWVYRADSLDAQLDRAARLALALPTWLRHDPATQQLTASNRLFEERADLGGNDLPGLMPLLGKYAPLAVRKTITARKLVRPDMFFEPDWKLNQYDHPRERLPGQVGADTTKAGPKR
ncbi:MAG: DUF547 domain-containing protein [Candidatus Eisenbacteria bacterium]|nr:DUF547 domain-containing protein [Candidatus Eisenbacteria bacterium]